MNTKYSEEHIGKTPRGGVRSVAYFFDENGSPAPKSKAKRVRIVEYDKDDNRINEAYLRKS